MQLVDLARLRRSLGPRWPELRSRVLGVAHATLARGLAPDELCVPGGEDRLYLLRVGRDRREHARHGELLAAEATARLCGTIPGGAGIHVRTWPFDLDAGLAGVDTCTELQARLAAATDEPRHATPGPYAAYVNRLEPRFRPLLNPRKRLVSAYHLAHGADGPAFSRMPAQDDELAAELDGWSLRQAARTARSGARAAAGRAARAVHYGTLATMRWREPFTQLCRRLPLGAARRLIFEVLGLPQGLPQPRVRELMAYIRPFCATIVVRLPPGPPRIEHLASSGVRGLSLAAGVRTATSAQPRPASRRWWRPPGPSACGASWSRSPRPALPGSLVGRHRPCRRRCADPAMRRLGPADPAACTALRSGRAASTSANSSASTLPPETTIPMVRSRVGSLPASAAASATAPPGSITSFRCRKASRIAAADLGIGDHERRRPAGGS